MLFQASDGNFYGTAAVGGASAGRNPNCPSGCGTVFKMTPAGRLTTLHNFCLAGACPDGELPIALTQGTDGNFYGATGGGGSDSCIDIGCGTVFKLTPQGKLTTLYRFCSLKNCTDGDIPIGLIQAADGNLYGVTADGGVNYASCSGAACGTIFKITRNGRFSTLHNFCTDLNCADGAEPEGLMQASDGNFYGTTFQGGGNDNGTVFKITPTGTLTTLYTFCSQPNCTDGEKPAAGLTQATDGLFYGTTWEGGLGNVGTIFSLDAGLGESQ